MTRRAIQCLAILLGIGLGARFAVAAEEERCTQQCSGDDARGQCPPSCPDCACAAHLPSAIAPPLRAMEAATIQTVPISFPAPNLARPAPDPRELLHVPR